MPHALVVEDDPNCLYALAELVEQEGFTTSTASTLADARMNVNTRTPDLVLLDLMLPDGNGIYLLKDLESLAGAQVVLITGHGTLDSAVEAFRLGAHDYLTKPVDIPRLKSVLASIAERVEAAAGHGNGHADSVTDSRPLAAPPLPAAHPIVPATPVAESAAMPTERVEAFGLLMGGSPAMQRVYDLIKKVASTEATVLLTGESGTGKDVVAETIHRMSHRQKGPYLPLNCGAISPNLIESELFGHERGSFTGASRLHKGYFERAHSGTLFLDEITEMPLELQVKLLRVLETGKIIRIGGDRQVEVDVRVIAATNHSLEEAVSEGKFREDLLYRLRVFPIHLPPLRDRADDIDLLIHYFTRQFNTIEGREKRFSEAALEKLRAHQWPGNVRELKNVVYRSYILADEVIGPECLPPDIGATEAAFGPFLHMKVGSSIADVEKNLIMATLEEYHGNKKKAAEILGISLKTLYNRLNYYKMI